MVILHVKRTDLNQFLYETNTSVPVADILDALVRCKFAQAFLFSSKATELEKMNEVIMRFFLETLVNNLRSKLDRACVGMEDLASKGPMRPEELRGLDNLDDYVAAEDLTVINGLKKMPPRTGVREVVDEHKYRTGWLVSEEMSN